MDFVLRAFSNGMDGVFIGGCRLNECNYTTHGNYHALNMTLLCRRILEHVGLDPARLSIEFMSSGEGNRFVDVTNHFVKTVKQLGPLGEAEGIDRQAIDDRLAGVRKLVPYIKMVKNEKLGTPLRNGEGYDTYFTREEIDSLFRDVVSYYIDPEKCQACMICARRCPSEAITGGRNQVHVIEQEKCIKCGTCLEVCPPRFGAVAKISGAPVPLPLPEDERAIVRKVESR